MKSGKQQVLPGPDAPGSTATAASLQESIKTLDNDRVQAADQEEQDFEADLEKRPSSIEPPYTVYNLSQKRLLVALVSIAGFFSPLNSNIASRTLQSG